MTVEYLFERLYKLQKNEVFISCSCRGVGLIASQWAKSIGAKMIGTVSTDEKASLAKNGCEFTINYKQEDVYSNV